MCIWFTSSMAPRHLIVAFKKHVFQVFRSPRPDFVGKELLSMFQSGSRTRLSLLCTFLEAKSCLVPVSYRRAGAWRGVVRLAAGGPILEPSVGLRKTCAVGLCCSSLARRGWVFSFFSPFSLLSSYFVHLPSLPVLSGSFSSGAVFLMRVFSHVGQGGVD